MSAVLEPYLIRHSQAGSEDWHFFTLLASSVADAVHRARCEIGNRMFIDATREADIPVARWTP